MLNAQQKMGSLGMLKHRRRDRVLLSYCVSRFYVQQPTKFRSFKNINIISEQELTFIKLADFFMSSNVQNVWCLSVKSVKSASPVNPLTVVFSHHIWWRQTPKNPAKTSFLLYSLLSGSKEPTVKQTSIRGGFKILSSR